MCSMQGQTLRAFKHLILFVWFMARLPMPNNKKYSDIDSDRTVLSNNKEILQKLCKKLKNRKL